MQLSIYARYLHMFMVRKRFRSNTIIIIMLVKIVFFFFYFIYQYALPFTWFYINLYIINEVFISTKLNMILKFCWYK